MLIAAIDPAIEPVVEPVRGKHDEGSALSARTRSCVEAVCQR